MFRQYPAVACDQTNLVLDRHLAHSGDGLRSRANLSDANAKRSPNETSHLGLFGSNTRMIVYYLRHARATFVGDRAGQAAHIGHPTSTSVAAYNIIGLEMSRTNPGRGQSYALFQVPSQKIMMRLLLTNSCDL
jgi:hypothetical protein